MELIDRVRKTVADYEMIDNGNNVIVGLSGGADSVCLLMVLKELSAQICFSLYAVHVNHCLRGEESMRDERFCTELCRQLDIPLEICTVDVRSYCDEKGKSCEEGARELRYEAFERLAERLDAKIATAHNKCDNSETVLFNLTRGTGVKGLCGIPYKRGNIIRPLLEVSREEIEDFLRNEKQVYVTDSTNLTDDYSRNRIRHRVIPQLSEINGNFHEAVRRLSVSAAEDEDYFEELISDLSPEDIPLQHSAVRKRYIKKLLTEKGISCSFDRLCELDGLMERRASTRYELSGDVFAFFRKGIMTVEQVRGEMDFSVPISFLSEKELDIPEFDKTVKITRIQDDIFQNNGNVQKKLTNHWLNCVKIQGVAVIRNKRDGDSIVLSGRNFSTKLKKLYNSMKLPLNERHSALVIEDEGGIIWSEYGGVSERTAAKDGDSREDIFEISIVRR